MNYVRLLEQLYSINRVQGIKPGLETISALCRSLGLPQMRYKTVHVAGTNGKGSVVTKIAAALAEEGYGVGLYTSPHISSFRERISINGTMIFEEEVVGYFEPVFMKAKTLGLEPTFFEYVTALAFFYFAEKGVDFAVLETGLGGRLDATNICMPIASVITSISLDHTAILGESREAIAREKAGILKEGVPVILGTRVPYEVIEPIAALKGCPIYVASGSFDDFERENQEISRQALHVIAEQIPLSKEAVERGLQKVPPCRFEIIENRIVLDVGHNPDGIEKLFRRLRKQFPNRSFHTVYGASYDKDIDSCLDIILNQSASLFFVEASSKRACPVDELVSQAKMKASNGKFFASSSVAEGVALAMDRAKKDGADEEGLVIVCGSFYIMSQVRAFLNICDQVDPVVIHEGAMSHARVC